MSENMEAIPYGHIYLKKVSENYFIGTVSNIQGEFKIAIPKKYVNDTVTISCIGFEDLKFRVKEFVQNPASSILMKESVSLLKGVVVHATSAKDIVKKSINSISKNYKEIHFLNKMYFEYSDNRDSILSRSLKKFSTNYEKHSEDVTQRILLHDSTLHFFYDSAQVVVPIFDTSAELLYFDIARTGVGVINIDNIDEWDFQFTYPDRYVDSEFIIISAKSWNSFQNFTLYINATDFAFKRIEFEYTWKKNSAPVTTSDSTSYNLYKVKGMMLYEKTKNKYGVKNIALTANYVFNKIGYPGVSGTMTANLTVLSSKELTKETSNFERSARLGYAELIDFLDKQE